MCVLYVSSMIFVCYLELNKGSVCLLCAAACDSIKIDLEEVGWEGLVWNDLAEDKERWRTFVNLVMKLGEVWGIW